MDIHSATEIAYRNGYEKGKSEGKASKEIRDVLYSLKRDVHENAVYPYSQEISSYITLKVFDATLQNYIKKYAGDKND